MVKCYMSRVRLFAYGFATFCFWVIFIAFCTPNWLASDQRMYGQLFVKLGLWESCFRSFVSPIDLDKRKFYAGCRWILTDEYQNLRDFLEPPFFIAVQVFYTIGFTALLVACVLILALHLCLSPEKDVSVIRIIGTLILISAACCTLAVVIFGALGDQPGWMPDHEHNYLSWSFALAVIGTFFEYIATILFFIESRLAKKREEEERDQHVVYRLEQQTHTKV